MESHGRLMFSPQVIRSYMNARLVPVSEPYGLTASSGTFLLEISAREGISLKDLSNRLMVDKALTTRVVQHLIEGGLVRNVSTNQRSYSLKVTERGAEAAAALHQAISQIHMDLIADLTEDEKRTFFTVMEKLYARIAAGTGHTPDLSDEIPIERAIRFWDTEPLD